MSDPVRERQDIWPIGTIITPLRNHVTSQVSGFIASPMTNPLWEMSCRYLRIDAGIFFSSTSSETIKIIWGTGGASEVITSDALDFIDGYMKPVTPLRLRGVASGTLVEGIGVVEYC